MYKRKKNNNKMMEKKGAYAAICECTCCFAFFSDDGEYESRLSQSKLVQLCDYEPIVTFVKASDHLLYQTLVEILIPDVLRPIPGMVLPFQI